MSAIDAYHATRNLIENSFSHLTWYEDVCTQSGFKGISQIWKEDPAWYFWLEQVKGSFLLRLHAEEPLSDNQFVSLSLHYFPAVDEPAYQHLSAGEKWLLSDEKCFDRRTNTPQFEAYEQFIGLFVVAEIGFVIDAENQLLTLLYSSEENAAHPAREFLDLLVNTLNFQSKNHHQRAFELQDDKVKTLFLDYLPAAFDAFIEEFQLDKNQLKQINAVEKFEKWKQAAHIDAVCSMSGACSCEH